MEKNKCLFCEFVEMREDICGTYCGDGHEPVNGDCPYYKEYQSMGGGLSNKERPSGRAIDC